MYCQLILFQKKYDWIGKGMPKMTCQGRGPPEVNERDPSDKGKGISPQVRLSKERQAQYFVPPHTILNLALPEMADLALSIWRFQFCAFNLALRLPPFQKQTSLFPSICKRPKRPQRTQSTFYCEWKKFFKLNHPKYFYI